MIVEVKLMVVHVRDVRLFFEFFNVILKAVWHHSLILRCSLFLLTITLILILISIKNQKLSLNFPANLLAEV